MTIEELKTQIKTMLPNAAFDVEYRTREIIIATGVAADKEGELYNVFEPDL